MKIGLVGVGKWGKTMASVLSRAGHEIAAHSRQGVSAEPGMGELVSWQYMLERNDLDALVLATPPETTWLIAAEAAELGFAVLASKPLLNATHILSNIQLSAPFFVDYVHLHSPLWQKLIVHVDTCPVPLAKIEVDFVGDGPIRDWGDGLLDYGPHAVAMFLELSSAKVEEVNITGVKKTTRWNKTSLWEVRGEIGKMDFALLIGNGSRSGGLRRATVTFETGQKASYEERVSGERRIGYFNTESFENHNPLNDTIYQFEQAIKAKPDESELKLDLELSADVEFLLSKIRIVSE